MRILPTLLAAFGFLPGFALAQTVARNVEPVVVTGAEVRDWSRLAAVVTCMPYPSGTTGGRDAHNGTTVVPPDVRTGVPVAQIAAYKWTGAWVEIPVQVDQMFPYCLSNPPSDFALYSGTDKELTYAWDTESWKKTDGSCMAVYPPGDGPTPDPVATLDDDDEIVFMASDAGMQAPLATLPPPGTTGGQAIAIVDPLAPGTLSFAYLFLQPGGSSFNTANGYVSYVRDPDADEWIDRFSIRADDPEILGVSNTGYGPNLAGTVCRTATYPGYPTDPDGTPRPSSDRFVRDGVTVTTDSYSWRASGRWMVRGVQVQRAGQPPATYGPDLIDRWKGRAFQQSPDSTISLVGFEDEQVNWEANSALIGERAGPVRAIREVWGADSGTNVTKTETYYRDAITYRYHVRVHPIPPDGLYTSWDYNRNVATTYYNIIKTAGVAIDGMNDDVGSVDGVFGVPAFFDAPDPTFNVPSAVLNWEQISGAGDAGSLVYIVEIKGATTAENPAVVPYYRDDSCLDDGTGDDPVARPWPGEASTDQRVLDGYCVANGKPVGCHVCRLRDDPGPCDVDCKLGETQGAHAAHGIHYFFSSDTDNAASPEVLTEIDAQQWQFAVPTAAPTNVGQQYGNVVIAPLQTAAVPYTLLPNPLSPTASDGAVVTDQNTAAQATLSGADLDNCELTFTIVTPPTHGALGSISNSGCALGLPSSDAAAVTYTPASGYAGSDSFTYKVNDGASDSPPATIAITVRAPTPPLCANRETGCRPPFRPGTASLFLQDRTPDTRDRLRWKWPFGSATGIGEIGDPVGGSTNYQLCVYDAGGATIGRASAPPGGNCNGRPCWRRAGNRLLYRSRALKLMLTPGGDGVARIQALGKGAHLGLGPLPATQPVTVQLKNSNGICWEAVYSAPARRNLAGRFQDKAD